MASDRTSPAKKSKGTPKKSPQSGNNRTSAQGRPTRSRRTDTPEAGRQRAGVPKTHPTRAPVAARKDSAAKRPRGG